MKSKGYKSSCGCKSTDSQWIELCPAHKAEWQEIHTRWKADHDAQKRILNESTKRESHVKRQ